MVIERTGQELVMYQKESIKQKERIANLEESGADIHDIRKQVAAPHNLPERSLGRNDANAS
jgi:hypothetical protein